jgi:hypothetical protein
MLCDGVLLVDFKPETREAFGEVTITASKVEKSFERRGKIAGLLRRLI